ncbi:MAG: glutamine synthetase type III [Lachnospiraceae bacterium]|jgi:glutamine synthetase|nr:glutamine synthetase type III [Lachnospiraceae bacterium]
MAANIPELFGSKVFNDAEMKKRLPKDVYRAFLKTIDEGVPLSRDLANVLSHAMKDWAMEQGATHFTHWFQPMTGITAEKHDAFLSPEPGGSVLMTFSGKELIKGEPDASSFPSGGLRATFEARGYTAWDPTSYAFVKDDTLCIPTAFCSYSGESLDKKTPLLRSMQALEKQTLRILRLFGDDTVRHATPMVGSEQEYFLVDEDLYKKRPDLIYTGRTLFGSKPPKGQEMDDHYFGSLKPRVSAFMKELEEELWKLGIAAKTRHNEVAPGQFELAPVFSTTNISTDHNQLTMEMMKRVASRHHMVCLLHEKPFAGVNGSGKHNNWSISTDAGDNLFQPSSTPSRNAQFLLFLTAVITAVDEYQDLLRLAIASAGNDHRLGANEAPPAIMSIFLGDELMDVVDSIIHNTDYQDKERTYLSIGADVLPNIRKDSTDRNRTSPIAFTGNKFEFRSVGSSASIAGCNIVINTIVADALSTFASRLEDADNFQIALDALIREELTKHQRILFNGNGYSDEWVKEAARRGLSNLPSTVEALPHFVTDKVFSLFARHQVYNRTEIVAHYEILLENYYKTIHIEAMTLADMVEKEILFASSRYQDILANVVLHKKALDLSADLERARLEHANSLSSEIAKELYSLKEKLSAVESETDSLTAARFYRKEIVPCMDIMRTQIDELESFLPSELWPYPTYKALLFSLEGEPRK